MISLTTVTLLALFSPWTASTFHVNNSDWNLLFRYFRDEHSVTWINFFVTEDQEEDSATTVQNLVELAWESNIYAQVLDEGIRAQEPSILGRKQLDVLLHKGGDLQRDYRQTHPRWWTRLYHVSLLVRTSLGSPEQNRGIEPEGSAWASAWGGLYRPPFDSEFFVLCQTRGSNMWEDDLRKKWKRCPSLYLRLFIHTADDGAVSLYEAYELTEGVFRTNHMADFNGTTYVKKSTGKFEDRRSDLTGVPIRAPSFETREPNLISKLAVTFELWNTWQAELNFTPVIIKNATKWLHHLQQNEIDIHPEPLALSPERAKMADFSFPFLRTDLFWHIRIPSQHFLEGDQVYLKPFTMGAWMAVGASVVLCCVAVRIITTNISQASDIRTECIWEVTATVLMQGPSTLFPWSSLRLGYVALGLTTVLVSAFYSGGFTSFLSVQKIHLPFQDEKGLQELVRRDPSWKYAHYVGGSSTYKLLQSLPGFKEFREQRPEIDWYHMAKWQLGNKSLATWTSKVIVLTSEWDLNSHLRNFPSDPIHCELYRVPFRKRASALLFRKEFPYRSIFDRKLRQMMYGGILKRIVDIHNPRLKPCGDSDNDLAPGLTETIAPFLLLSSGAILGLGVLLGEWVFHRVNLKNSHPLGRNFSWRRHFKRCFFLHVVSDDKK